MEKLYLCVVSLQGLNIDNYFLTPWTGWYRSHKTGSVWDKLVQILKKWQSNCLYSPSQSCLFSESRICFTATSFSYPHYFCTREIGWDGCHFLCLNCRNMDHHAVTYTQESMSRKVNISEVPCDTDKIWALIPPSLKQMSNFWLSGVVQDGAERGSLQLKDDLKVLEG